MMTESDRFGLETSIKLARTPLNEGAREHLLAFVDLLRSWQKAKNLVGSDTLKSVWTRHIADGLQLIPLIERSLVPSIERRVSDTLNAPLKEMSNASLPVEVLDLGSGAGLPGAVIALARPLTMSNATAVVPIVKAGSPIALHLKLVESNGRKASFLRTVSRETGVPMTVRNSRIEALHDDESIAPDIVTARALAPLTKLVDLAGPWLEKGATALFHKGGEYGRELAEWADVDQYDVVEHVSVVDPASRILQITRRGASKPRQAS